MHGMAKIVGFAVAMIALAAPLGAQEPTEPSQGPDRPAVMEPPRGGPGAMRGGMMGPGMRGGPDTPRNPVAVLLEHAEALALTGDQVESLQALEARLAAENEPRLEELDTALGDIDPRGMSPEERKAHRERMRALEPVRRAVRQANRAAMAEARALLTDGQKAELHGLMRRGPMDRPGPATMRRGQPGPHGVGAAYRAGFRDGFAAGRRGPRPWGARPGG